MRTLMVFAVALALPTTALADDAKPAAPEKKICRTEEFAGTLFSKRVCHTASEWTKIDERNRSDAQNFNDSSNAKPNLPR